MSKTKLALKRLTASDLTLFEWQFRHINAGNQKAINLNRDVFIDQLYPALPDAAAELEGRVPLDLWIYGPGSKSPINLQRKIVKFGTYKNWRLNGEFIHNPEDDVERFNQLAPGDFALFEFDGTIVPSSARMLLVSANYPEDIELHQAFESIINDQRMISVSAAQLAEMFDDISLSLDHAALNFVTDEALEDAAQGGVEGMERLWDRIAQTRLSPDALEKARRNAEGVGQNGEQLINDHFSRLKGQSQIAAFEWVSQKNAVAPYDFTLTEIEEKIVIDVKSTTGDFQRKFHVSMNELLQMANGEERYDLYRIYELNSNGAKLRVARNLKSFACSVLNAIRSLPPEVTPDGFSVNPACLQFEEEATIEVFESEEE